MPPRLPALALVLAACLSPAGLGATGFSLADLGAARGAAVVAAGDAAAPVRFTLAPATPADRIDLHLPAPEAAAARSGLPAAAPGGGPDNLRHLIGWAEAGQGGYDAVQHGARSRPARPPTRMTIAEIYRWIDRTPGQPHAIGRYQFIPSTLRTLVAELGLSRQARFTPEVQDRLADLLLEDAGFSAFLAGRIGRHRFMENLARIWAGFPTSTGRSYYHGQAGNRAVITWEEFDSHMRRIFPRRG